MSKIKTYLLTSDSMADQITALNFAFPYRRFKVSKKWFKRANEYGYLPKCRFLIEVSDFMFYPIKPELL